MARHFALLAAFCCLNYVTAQQNAVVNVDIYYESLCPDSIYFITKELAPVYDELKSFMRVNLVPFGKASWVLGDRRRPTEFQCQHGPSECYGNKAQACALYAIQQSTTGEQQQHQSVKVVNCIMSSRYPARATAQCAQDNGLSQQSLDVLKNCMRGDLGDQLLINMGERTKAFESRISFVPSIAINGVKNPSAFRNFARVVCNEIPQDQRPEVCRHV
ncbi:GILT-like protein 1 [Phymastichus coffea]|uniref:GILT-like protein 1 n=1 Tax=Phymastichus coffea TaxID=108790 RepID=UPI00273BE63C|nr:GILT-like protein 1 [Phymastichus coffea]